MLSKENARFKSALESTKSQIDRDSMLKIKLPHIRGTLINSIMNFIIFLTVMGLDKEIEFIADFRKIWFIVSQRLVRTIRKKIKGKPCFILNSPVFL